MPYFQQQQNIRPPGSAQQVVVGDDVNQNNVNKSSTVSSKYSSAVNQTQINSCAGGGSSTAQSAPSNNNNLVNSNISVNFNRAGAEVSCVPSVGTGILNNNYLNTRQDYNNYSEKNNNAENKYGLANGHNNQNPEEVSQTVLCIECGVWGRL